MNLDYGTLLSPEPIKLSIGTIRKPTLKEISELSFERFSTYQLFLNIKPEDYYTKIRLTDGAQYWESLSDEEKKFITMYDVIKSEKEMQAVYAEILSFFFVERVIYQDGIFFILSIEDDTIPESEININSGVLRGVIHDRTFPEVLDILQQICCIKEEVIDDSDAVFKNEKAKKLWERMKKAKEMSRKKAKADINLTLPNIISSVAAKSNNLNIISIWDITLFQLYDQFNRLQNNDAHYINSIRVSVWGDEKKKFDYALWYKNIFNRNNSLL